MKARLVEWSIVGAAINMEDVDSDEIAAALRECVRLHKEGRAELARKALPPLRFEWDWSNAADGARKLFASPDDFFLLLTEENSTVSLSVSRDHPVISVSARFELSPTKNLSRSALTELIDDRELVYCGFVSGGWSYLQDEGQELRVIS